VPATKSIMNEFIVTFFDNSRATGGSGREHLHKVLSGGRVMSIFWQVSTFGMFAVLCLGLLVAQFTGARIIKSKALVILLFILSIVGGVISGSKVFTGGLLILVILCVLFSRVRHYLTRPRYIVMATVAVLLFFLLIPRILPQAYSLFAVRFKPDTFIATYNAGRFTPTFITSESFALEHPSGILVPPKIVRTGAVEIFKNYPLTGLGLSAAARTTDSFLFGILIMGGVIGGFIFILFIGIVCWRLLSIARQHPDRTVASLSLAMLFLTIVFFAAAAGFHTFIQDRVGDAYWLIVGLLFTMGIRNNEQAKLCHEKIQ